jgi:predicted nucleic acid-binding protein
MRSRLADRVLPVDEPVADAWALLGIPNQLSLIDGLLAATAKVHDLTFVTRNIADITAAAVSLLDPFSAAQ